MSRRWICPDCPVQLVDAPDALEHEQRFGHGVPTYQVAKPRHRPVPPVPGQLELPGT